MLTALLLAAAISRPYHPATVATMATTHHTHVAVTGVVTLVTREADGDIHFRIADAQGRFVVCEILRIHPLPAPTKGQRVLVRGIRRYDDERGHHWYELHPVEAWEPVP